MTTYANGKEFQGLVPNSQCYTTLGRYNATFPSQIMAPVAATQVLANRTLVIPSFGSLGYQSLTHGVGGNCTNYFNRTDAYPGIDAQGNCTSLKYIARSACGN